MRAATSLWRSGPLIVGLAILALYGCENERGRATPEPHATSSPATSSPAAAPAGPTTNVNEVRGTPCEYYGKKVTLAGEADEIYGDRAFDLDGAGWAFNDNIVVLTKTPVRLDGMNIAKGDELIVTGDVRRFVAADLNRDLGWTIPPDLQSRIEKRPVLVADTIRSSSGYGRWNASGAGANEPIATTFVILNAREPAGLVGRKVDLGHERVQSVMGKGLWVGPTVMSEVFVLPKEKIKDIKVGDWVHVADGTLQTAPKDAVKEWSLPASMEGLAWDRMLYVRDATVTKAPEKPAAGKGDGHHDNR